MKNVHELLVMYLNFEFCAMGKSEALKREAEYLSSENMYLSFEE